ncbi:MAG TPA: fasciclin domain-containing protein [Pseudonocardiaceae bacterium]|nr:fasciclin domain-containing protein [Pseudonocardiaceae bacterium]
MKRIQRLAAVGAMAALAAVVGACSSGQGPATGSQAPAPSAESAAPSGEAAAPTGTGVTKISDIFGPACSQVPKEGAGSAQGMVNDPVATAASHNPLLTTLAKAVTAANLVDTLNSAPALTVFAPADSAFQALEAQHPGILTQLTTAPDVASPNSKLAKLLTYHVVGTRYDAAGLVQAGTVDSLEGGKIKIGGTAEAPTVNGASVLCGNIPTKNATVFVISQVLSLPAS